MLDDHIRVYAATDIPFAGYPHEAGGNGRNQIIENAVGHCFVEAAFFTEGPHVHFQGFEFDTSLIGHEIDLDRGKIGLAGFRAQASELRDRHVNGIVAVREGVGKGFECFAGLSAHESPCISIGLVKGRIVFMVKRNGMNSGRQYRGSNRSVPLRCVRGVGKCV